MQTRELIAKVRKIRIRTRRTVQEFASGAYHSVFKGKGMEFADVRAYEPGDDVRGIDWNVTARMGHPFVKTFMEERELSVSFVVDVSASLEVGAAQPKRELIAELAAVLAFSAIHNQDRAGLLLFSEQIELLLPPRKGTRHGLRVIRELLAFQPKGRRTDIAGAAEWFRKTARGRHVVFVVSDFLGADCSAALRLLRQRHDVIAVRVLDASELAPPVGGYLAVADVEDGTGGLLHLHGGNRRRCAAEAAAEAERVRGEILAAGVDLLDLRTGADYMPALMGFFRQRERRQQL